MSLSKNEQLIANTLGLSINKISDDFIRQAAIAAQAIADRLNNMLGDLQATSESGSLDGYQAIAVPAKDAGIVLSKSRLRIAGLFAWVVYVAASSHHKSIHLNVFDILDTGREGLPKRSKAEGPYPLWGLSPEQRLPTGPSRVGGRFSVAARVASQAQVRQEPRQPGKKVSPAPTAFTWGPIDSQKANNLYARAVPLAKNKLRRAGIRIEKGVWDVIYTPDRDKEIK